MPELLRHGMLQRQAQLDQGDRVITLLQGVLTGLAPRAAPGQQQAMLGAPPVISRTNTLSYFIDRHLSPASCALESRRVSWRSGHAMWLCTCMHHTMQSSCPCVRSCLGSRRDAW